MRRNQWMAAVAVVAMQAGAAIAADIAALERQLEEARIAAPITVEPFVISKKPAEYFGDYEPRKDAVFSSGEQMYFYAEPKNLVVPRNAQGVYRVAFAVDLEVTAQDGKAMKKKDFAKLKLDSRSRIQDLFLKLDVALTKAPPGKYNVKFTIRDQNSKKALDFAKDVTIK
jgi:hypothetical protein